MHYKTVIRAGIQLYDWDLISFKVRDTLLLSMATYIFYRKELYSSQEHKIDTF